MSLTPLLHSTLNHSFHIYQKENLLNVTLLILTGNQWGQFSLPVDFIKLNLGTNATSTNTTRNKNSPEQFVGLKQAAMSFSFSQVKRYLRINIWGICLGLESELHVSWAQCTLSRMEWAVLSHLSLTLLDLEVSKDCCSPWHKLVVSPEFL